jgi:hypothetical protein
MTPYHQFSSDQGSAFRHAAQSVVSHASLVCQNPRIDPHAIVADAQAEVVVVVTEVDLESCGMRMPKGIPKGFRGNLVNLVTNDGAQIARVALDGHTECGRPVGARVSPSVIAFAAHSRRATNTWPT